MTNAQIIPLEKVLKDFENFLIKKGYFLYDIINKKQILNLKKTEHFDFLNRDLKIFFTENVYSNQSFKVSNKVNYQCIKTLFAWILNEYLELNNIDISTIELIKNDDVNIDNLAIFAEWVNLDIESMRQFLYNSKYFVK